jgi:formylglycine-generating enzyme required for sulfatase activity
MAHDVFISYSSNDKVIADAVCAGLEAEKIRCWIAPRDVLPGMIYSESLLDALEASRVLVLVFSASSNASPHVLREVEIALKNEAIIIPFRIEDVPPSRRLSFFLSSIHWLDALTPPLEAHIKSLTKTMHRLLGQDVAEPALPAGGEAKAERKYADRAEPNAGPRPKPADRPIIPPPARSDETPQTVTNTLGMKFALIPAGEFAMGSPAADKDAYDDEKPQHQVRITQPFYLGVTEVTQGQYRAVTGQNPSQFQGADNLPVETVSWNDAVAFCNALSTKEGRTYRLPTEAEWEYACRAGNPGRFAFGDDDRMLDRYAWYVGNSDTRTHPVGQKQPNSFGLYDMHGNVWEWCADGYSADYYKESPGVDPPGPSGASVRVGRGGSWFSDPRVCRSAGRYGNAPGVRLFYLGFRLALVQSPR